MCFPLASCASGIAVSSLIGNASTVLRSAATFSTRSRRHSPTDRPKRPPVPNSGRAQGAAAPWLSWSTSRPRRCTCALHRTGRLLESTKSLSPTHESRQSALRVFRLPSDSARCRQHRNKSAGNRVFQPAIGTITHTLPHKFRSRPNPDRPNFDGNPIGCRVCCKREQLPSSRCIESDPARPASSSGGILTGPFRYSPQSYRRYLFFEERHVRPAGSGRPLPAYPIC